MKAELKKIVEDNILAYYKSIARLLEGEFIESDNVSWYNTGCKSHFRFNGVVRTTPSGFPVYRRLGFEAISAADIYVWSGNS